MPRGLLHWIPDRKGTLTENQEKSEQSLHSYVRSNTIMLISGSSQTYYGYLESEHGQAFCTIHAIVLKF